MLAKEIAVPLVILLALLPGRKRALIPHGVAFAVYMLWRRLVLGTFFGGYGWVFQASDLPSLPKKLFLGMAGANVALGAVVVILVITGTIAALRRNAILVVAALVIAIAPIVPVSKEMQRRFVLMPWMALSFAFVAGAETLPRRARAALLVVAPLLAIAANRQEWRQEFPRMKRMSDEARVFFDLPVNGLLRAPLVDPSAMIELNWLKTAIAARPPGAGWFYDDFYLCVNDVRGKRVWQYDAKEHRVVERTTIEPKDCSALRPAPITMELRFRDGILYWKFGPYPDGTWRVLIADGVQAFDVPPRDAFRLGDIPGLTLRVRYQSPAGWIAVSHPITLDFRGRP